MLRRILAIFLIATYASIGAGFVDADTTEYAVFDTFNNPEGNSQLEGWQMLDEPGAGNYAEVVPAPNNDGSISDVNKCLNLNKTTEGREQGFIRNFSPLEGKVVVEQKIMVQNGNDLSHIPYILDSTGAELVHLMVSNTNFYVHDGSTGNAPVVAMLEDDVWYYIAAVIDVDAGTFDTYLDGQLVKKGAMFTGKVNAKDVASVNILPRVKGGMTYSFKLDFLKVYPFTQQAFDDNLKSYQADIDEKIQISASREGFRRSKSPMEVAMEDKIIMCLENAYCFVNGEKVWMDHNNSQATPIQKDRITYIPLEFAEKLFGENLREHEEYLIQIEGIDYLNVFLLTQKLNKKVMTDTRGLIVVSDNENAFNKTKDKQIINNLVWLFYRENSSGNPKNFYVSTNGSDQNDGKTVEKPFKTLEAAKEAVREEISNGMSSDIIVYIRSGKYYFEEKLTFNAKDGGKGKYRVIYKNYQDEVPELIGGKVIKEWEQMEGNVYKARIGRGLTVTNVMENGELSVKARTPNQGYFIVPADSPNGLNTTRTLKEANDPARNQLVFDSQDIPYRFDHRNAEAFTWPGEGEWNWFSDLRPITSVDYKNSIIEFDNVAGYKIARHSRYYLQGAREFLDMAGEYSYDKESGDLYYMPRDGAIEDQEIVVATTARLIELRGNSQAKPVKNIEFIGLTFNLSSFTNLYLLPVDNNDREDAKQGLIHLENAEDNAIRFCNIKNAGYSGIMLNGYAKNNIIYGNRIENVGFHGVSLAGFKEDLGEDVNRFNTVSNNYISNGGLYIGHGSGIVMIYSGNNEISYNHIQRFPRYGVSIKGTPIGGVERYSKNNMVQFNNIYDVMYDSQDGGGIESWNPGHGNTYHNNRIYGLKTDVDGGGVIGLYMDDESHVNKITNNIIYNINQKNGYGMLIKARNSQISNNVIADSGIIADTCYQSSGKGSSIFNNIFNMPGGNVLIAYYADKLHKIDRNVYYHPFGSYNMNGAAQTYEAWLLVEDKKFDQNSIIADPLFIDAEGGNYGLKENSPAFNLGIESIDQLNIGLSVDFPRRATDRIEGEKYNFGKDMENTQVSAHPLTNGSYVKYSNVDFENGEAEVFVARLSTKIKPKGSIEIRTASPNGPLIGTLNLTNTGGLTRYSVQNTQVKKTTGKKDLYLVFLGDTAVCNLDWFTFGTKQDLAEFIVDNNIKNAYNQFSLGLSDHSQGTEFSEELTKISEDGAYLIFENVYLGDETLAEINVLAEVTEAQGGTVEFRRENKDGELVGTVVLGETGEQLNYHKAFVGALSGVSDIAVVFKKEEGKTSICSIKTIGLNEVVIKDAREQIKGVDFDAMQGVVATDALGSLDEGDWSKYSNVDFKNGMTKFVAMIGCDTPYAGGFMEIRLDSLDGEVIGRQYVKSTGSWTEFDLHGTEITRTSGIHDVYLTYSQTGTGNLMWFKFE